ncbi:unnamed protein product [Cuscuta campestris]|uniref:Uncharacterized protein n=1 Tax=Cuscuta campestris TaxID=132261 RepID=A0A484NGX8_9ASTE|nr:unnamed protein product [Cuscuta campestris]
MAMMSRSNAELFDAFYAVLSEEWATQLVQSQSDETLRMKAMIVTSRKDTEAGWLAAEKMKGMLVEQAKAYQGMFAKHEGLLKESDKQARSRDRDLVDSEILKEEPQGSFVPRNGGFEGLSSEDKRKLSTNAKVINILHPLLVPTNSHVFAHAKRLKRCGIYFKLQMKETTQQNKPFQPLGNSEYESFKKGPCETIQEMNKRFNEIVNKLNLLPKCDKAEAAHIWSSLYSHKLLLQKIKEEEMLANLKLTNAFKLSKDSSSEELSESSDESSDSSSSEESNDEEDEEKAMRMKYTNFLKWKKYEKRKETYSKSKKERHKSRPDITYAVQQLCLHLHAPHDSHLTAMKRVLRYLSGTATHDRTEAVDLAVKNRQSPLHLLVVRIAHIVAATITMLKLVSKLFGFRLVMGVEVEDETALDEVVVGLLGEAMAVVDAQPIRQPTATVLLGSAVAGRQQHMLLERRLPTAH